VLAQLALTLHRGELVAVVGPSGAGKTTLVHVLAGLRSPDAGEISVLGTPLDPRDLDQSDRLRREVVGFMAQDLNLLPELCSVRNAALPVLLAGGSTRESIDAAERILQALGMGDCTHQPVRELSRGQRQRVALARALSRPRPVLLLDEPTASLDPDTKDKVCAMARQHAQRGAAVLIATHDVAVAQQADRVLHLSSGRLEAQT